MKVLITGSKGFIGKNLVKSLQSNLDIDVLEYTRKNNETELEALLVQSDFVFHLAGVNRSNNQQDFIKGNVELTRTVIECLKKHNKQIPVVYASSIQATNNTIYGQTKKKAEEIIWNYATDAYIFRLPNVFGPESLPNYNSVIATFCYNISHEIPIVVDQETKILHLVYVDDVVNSFIEIMLNSEVSKDRKQFCTVSPIYEIRLGELARLLQSFKHFSPSLESDELSRKLYQTYLSYI